MTFELNSPYSDKELPRDFADCCRSIDDQRLVRVLQNEYTFWQETGDREDYHIALTETKSRGWTVRQDTNVGLLVITTPNGEFTCDANGKEIDL